MTLQRRTIETIIDHVQMENGSIGNIIAFFQRLEVLYGEEVKLKNPNGPTHLCVVSEELEPEEEYHQRVKEYIAEHLNEVDLEAVYNALKEVFEAQ